MEMVQVGFGNALTLYINGQLCIYRRAQDYDEVIKFLADHIHEEFDPIKFIGISDCSTYWDKEPGHSDSFGEWAPDARLDDLIKKLDPEEDVYADVATRK